MQYPLSRVKWDDAAVRADVREYSATRRRHRRDCTGSLGDRYDEAEVLANLGHPDGERLRTRLRAAC
jgi:hypothetical protein